jgi:hypothetical protein
MFYQGISSFLSRSFWLYAGFKLSKIFKNVIMKNDRFQDYTRRVLLVVMCLVITMSNFAQNKQIVIDSLSNVLYVDFGRKFTLDPSMIQGCINSARESYFGELIPPVNGQAHYHARLKMEGEPVLGVLKMSTVIREIRALIERQDAYDYLTEISAHRFWVQEVQVEDTYFLVVGLD